MSRKLKPSKNAAPLVSRKLEAIVRQIARVESGEDTSSFTIKELKAIRDELLVEANG